jgi:hypothetical protein
MLSEHLQAFLKATPDLVRRLHRSDVLVSRVRFMQLDDGPVQNPLGRMSWILNNSPEIF